MTTLCYSYIWDSHKKCKNEEIRGKIQHHTELNPRSLIAKCIAAVNCAEVKSRTDTE